MEFFFFGWKVGCRIVLEFVCFPIFLILDDIKESRKNSWFVPFSKLKDHHPVVANCQVYWRDWVNALSRLALTFTLSHEAQSRQLYLEKHWPSLMIASLGSFIWSNRAITDGSFWWYIMVAYPDSNNWANIECNWCKLFQAIKIGLI